MADSSADQQQRQQEILNLTPHDVNVYLSRDDDDDEPTVRTYPASRKGAVRVRTKLQTLLGTLEDGVPVYSAPAFEDALDNFPFDPAEDEVEIHHPDIIVSMVVAPHVPNWYGGCVYVPDTGPSSAVRSDAGRMLGVKRFYLARPCRGAGKNGKKNWRS